MIFKAITDETILSGQRIVGDLQARKIAQEQAIKQTNLNIQCLRKYENTCKNGSVSSADFTGIMGKASNYLATASKRAIEKTKELQQEISKISSDYQSERQTLEGLRKEYEALTSKIGENGAEASLSADEYERYRDIASEILSITPKLITGWDEEGRAISNKNGLLQQSIDLLDEEYQKGLRNSTTKSKNEEIAAGIIEQKKDFDNSGNTKTISGA